MIIIGLTGSIGMGKSTTLRLFEDEGCSVWDADAAVHRLYAPGGRAVARVEALFPGTTSLKGGVDRSLLADRLRADPSGFPTLEAVVHPLVREDRQAFLARAQKAGSTFAVVDVPLLFETGAETEVDVVVVASAPADVQRRRVLDRPGMTVARFEQILARQMPDADKRSQADFVVDTGRSIAVARDQVRVILETLCTPGWLPKRSSGLHRRSERSE